MIARRACCALAAGVMRRWPSGADYDLWLRRAGHRPAARASRRALLLVASLLASDANSAPRPTARRCAGAQARACYAAGLVAAAAGDRWLLGMLPALGLFVLRACCASVEGLRAGARPSLIAVASTVAACWLLFDRLLTCRCPSRASGDATWTSWAIWPWASAWS